MNSELYEKLWGIFKKLGAEALAMNHYDLSEITKIEAMVWKQFLMEPEVSEWIKTEITLIQESELKKMIQGVNKTNSIGRAQLMNTLSKMSETKTTKEGPIFIYTYVPLNPEQTQAENIKKLDKDIFLKESDINA